MIIRDSPTSIVFHNEDQGLFLCAYTSVLSEIHSDKTWLVDVRIEFGIVCRILTKRI